MAASDLRVARRYAKALFNVARAAGAVAAVQQNLQLVQQMADASGLLMGVLRHPRIARQRKNQVLENLFQQQVRPELANFMALLVEKDRAGLLPQIHQQFNQLVDEDAGIVDACVTSAVPLQPRQQDKLRDRLQAISGKSVRMEYAVDPALLAGLNVRLGDRLIDASAAAELDSLRLFLQQAKVV